MTDAPSADRDNSIELTTEIVSAFVARNSVAANDLPALISSVHATLSGLGSQTAPAIAAESLKPAISIKKSITPDYLISLEDGRPYKSLKRHLSTKHDLTPQAYRAKWNLPKDYPMVAPNYAAARSLLAKQIGLGQSGRKAAKAGAKK